MKHLFYLKICDYVVVILQSKSCFKLVYLFFINLKCYHENVFLDYFLYFLINLVNNRILYTFSIFFLKTQSMKVIRGLIRGSLYIIFIERQYSEKVFYSIFSQFKECNYNCAWSLSNISINLEFNENCARML